MSAPQLGGNSVNGCSAKRGEVFKMTIDKALSVWRIDGSNLPYFVRYLILIIESLYFLFFII